MQSCLILLCFRSQTTCLWFVNSYSKVWGDCLENNVYCWSIFHFYVFYFMFADYRPLPTHLHMIYFWYSLSFLIMRTFAVSFLIARIDDESRQPIDILRTIPSHLWNEETRRFRGDILCKRVALSGMEFFYVTREFILSVTGTIITYELVLIEFNRKWMRIFTHVMTNISTAYFCRHFDCIVFSISME